MAPGHEDRSLALRIGASIALLLLLLGQAQVTVLDGSSMLAVAQSIVHDGSLAVPPRLGVPGEHGLAYSKYGLLLPLLSVVPVALVQPLGLLTGRVDLLEAAAAASLMPLVSGALAAALYLLGRRLGARPRAAALVAAGTVLGTFLLPYGRDFFTEPLVALGVVVMVERALAGREAQAGAALALAVLARPQSALLVPLLWAFVALRGRDGPDEEGAPRAAGDAAVAVARTLAPLAVAAAITVAYNVVRFGDPLSFGYEPPTDPGFTTPPLRGAAGLLASPEKALALFAPAIVLVPFALVALWRRRPATTALLCALFAVTFALAATWHSWMGGWSWGPRLLIPGVATVLVALGPWIGASARRMRLACVLFVLGFVMSLPAVLAPAGTQLLRRDPGADGPKLTRQLTDLPRLTRNSIDAASDPAARGGDYRRYLALWQAGLVRQAGTAGIPVALMLSAALLAAFLWVLRPLARRLAAA